MLDVVISTGQHAVMAKSVNTPKETRRYRMFLSVTKRSEGEGGRDTMVMGIGKGLGPRSRVLILSAVWYNLALISYKSQVTVLRYTNGRNGTNKVPLAVARVVTL